MMPGLRNKSLHKSSEIDDQYVKKSNTSLSRQNNHAWMHVKKRLLINTYHKKPRVWWPDGIWPGSPNEKPGFETPSKLYIKKKKILIKNRTDSHKYSRINMSILVEWVIVDVNESFTIKKRIDN